MSSRRPAGPWRTLSARTRCMCFTRYLCARASICATATSKGRFQRSRAQAPPAGWADLRTERQARLRITDGRDQHRYDHGARRHPQPAVSGRAARRARSARAVRRRVRDRADRGRGADHRSRHSARGGAVRSARRLRLCRRCAEQGGATAHPARPVDPVHGRGEQWAQGRRAGHQRGAAAGSPRRDRVTQSGDPAAGDFPGG